jgi:hypothetical protein
MRSIKNIAEIVNREWAQHPLRLILLLAVVTRLAAVFLSRGFGWFDDHFLIIEASQSWVDGHDYNNWLPWSEGNSGPGGHNLFYAGIHYVLFRVLEFMGLYDPQGKMYVVRLLHAALSLPVVVLGYRLARQLEGLRAARMAGLLLAILWLFPFISVRNLIEYTCVPFLLWGTWILSDRDSRRKALLRGFLAGLVLGIAFSMRFQSLVYTGGIGLGLLILGRWREALSAGFGVIVSAFLLLGTIDIFIWGYPFAELYAYIDYNMHHYTEYVIGPWYQYLLVILGALVPPVSLFLVYGFFHLFFKDWKRSLLIFLPVLLFVAFHSYYPNKQERFILPVLPFIIISGTAGWYTFMKHSAFWQKRRILYRSLWAFFWVVNTIVLVVITTTYSKRARVESMIYLSKYENINNILVENSNKSSINLLPMFYLGQWVGYSEVTDESSAREVALHYQENNIPMPDFFIFEGEKNIDQRIDDISREFPGLEYETTIAPGMIDRILFRLNPVNENQNAYIYRNAILRPEKKE